jgi:hypothetical protein
MATILFALPVLIAGALGFLLQPMFGRMVLPRLGGAPAVWNTCMLFFQAALLAGYAYAHAVARWPVRRQVVVHAIVLLLPLVVLPVALPARWTPPTSANPAPWLLVVLAASVGLPFFAVATTSPLVQAWFHRTTGGADPYFLYSASNVGSIGGLLAYPLVIEPTLRLHEQSRAWTIGYVALLAALVGCTARVWSSATPAAGTPAEGIATTPPSRRRQLRWVALAFIPSSYLLGVTTFITSDIAAVPLLWVVPLAIYLLTFVIAFSRKPVIPHRHVLLVLPVTTLVAVLFVISRAAQPVGLVLAVHLVAFFVAALACHGELARLRPPGEHLTRFYLMLSIGGVAGGAFNALLAPVLFAQPTEYPLAIALAAMARPRKLGDVPAPAIRRLNRALDVALPLLVALLAWPAVSAVPARTVPGAYGIVFALLSVPLLLCLTFVRRPRRFALGVAAIVLAFALAVPAQGRLRDVRRSFFGVHRVLTTADGAFNELFHGTTLHGLQRIDDAGRPVAPDRPTSYYHLSGPIGDIFAALGPDRVKRVGVVGLGAGAMAAYARDGTAWTYFEIDPVVGRFAEETNYFTYFAAARQRGADVRVIFGDARLTVAGAPDGSFNLLALDAFSGDAMPVHLLTREAVAMYRRKLADHGLLVVNISNLYVNLEPTVANLAADAGCVCAVRDDADVTKEQIADGKQASEFAVIAAGAEDVAPLLATGRWRRLAPDPSRRVWTDDYSNVLGVLKWRRQR